MKIYHVVFETILIAITILVLMNSILTDGVFAFLSWWFILGVLQVIHAIGLGYTFCKTPAIWRFLKWYFVGVYTDLLLLFLLGPIGTNSNSSLILPIGYFILFIFPAMLALYLWFITWHFRRPPLVGKTG